MSLVQANAIQEVYVGDKKALEFSFLKEDGLTPRDLTGHAAEVSFWHEDLAPHIVRAATVDPVNGLVKYDLRGDEFDSVGEVLVTATVLSPDFFASSFPLVRRLVRRRPT